MFPYIFFKKYLNETRASLSNTSKEAVIKL